MKKICVIPARMGSSRYPGKPLELALDIPLIIHVAKRCLLNKNLDRVIVATCDNEIIEACNNFGVESVITGNHHERCTDRVSEAINNLNLDLKSDDFVLMVQGDEILITPQMLDDVIDDYVLNKKNVVNLLSRIYSKQDHEDPNVVKVVSTPLQNALYFSRAPIPSTYRDENAKIYQQTGVIGFSKEFLMKFSELPQTPLEKIESIDMLRVLEHHLPLRVVYSEKETIAVDVPSDMQRAIEILKQDFLVKQYA